MADIDNPQAVAFCNTRARKIADLIRSLDRTIPQFLLEVVRDFEELTVGNADGDLILDGAAEDGRAQVVKLNVGQLKFVCEQILACIDTDDRRDLVNNWVVNGQPIF